MWHKLNFILITIPPLLIMGTPGFSMLEYVYAAYLSVNVLLAFTNSKFDEREIRLLLISSAFITLLAIVGLFVSLISGVGEGSYAGVINFIIIASWLFVIPRVAMDLESDYIIALLVTFGLIGAFGTYYKWSQLRGYTEFSNQSVALDSDWSVYLIIILVISFWKNLKIFRKAVYLSALIISCVLLVLTGTRTYIVVFVWMAMTIFLLKKSLRRPLAYLLSTCLILLSVFNTFVPSLAVVRYKDLLERLKLNGLQGLFFGIDESTLARSIQREFYFNVWNENLFFGEGLLKANSVNRLYADTPIATISNIGLVGLSFVIVVILYASFVINYRMQYRNNSFQETYVLLLSLLIPISFAYDWIVSKSFWFTLSCVLGLMLSGRKRESTENAHTTKNQLLT